ncbi:MAG TPA: PP2C family protein-serine/threonine phosphatase [Candidatus Sulfomarinibacteraceae bacterium]|nr:PP2C family protein-serine/threonine phosphatase [Candidatus Sulfomarinibacteraceae bacterium]
MPARSADDLAPSRPDLAGLPDLDEASVSDDELMLDERTALASFFDAANARRLAFVLWFFAATLAIYALASFVSGRPVVGTVAGLAVVADLALLRHRAAAGLLRILRQTVAAILIGHLVVLQVFHSEASGGIGIWFSIFPFIAARFRLASGETVALFGSLYAVVAVRLVGESLLMRQSPPFLSLTLYALVFLVGFAVSWVSSRRLETRFLTRWRAESARNRDRLRMKQELEYAREIQLSMLPRQAPRLEWLDVAALSLPATEVGGDYYDYFILDRDRLAVVVGDVTGHGVASGLVLSGVRSSLNLLHDEMARPGAVLDRVNLMLKRTSAPRMHMTLAVALLDRISGTAVVATAGHPPALIRRRGGTVEEVGSGAFPLGAMEDARYVENRVEIGPGDVLLLYSDGLVETMDPTGDQFGWERLTALLEGLGEGLSAAQVREAVLREVWDFKDAAPQVDDVTMVVIVPVSVQPQ